MIPSTLKRLIPNFELWWSSTAEGKTALGAALADHIAERGALTTRITEIRAEVAKTTPALAKEVGEHKEAAEQAWEDLRQARTDFSQAQSKFRSFNDSRDREIMLLERQLAETSHPAVAELVDDLNARHEHLRLDGLSQMEYGVLEEVLETLRAGVQDAEALRLEVDPGQVERKIETLRDRFETPEHPRLLGRAS